MRWGAVVHVQVGASGVCGGGVDVGVQHSVRAWCACRSAWCRVRCGPPGAGGHGWLVRADVHVARDRRTCPKGSLPPSGLKAGVRARQRPGCPSLALEHWFRCAADGLCDTRPQVTISAVGLVDCAGAWFDDRTAPYSG